MAQCSASSERPTESVQRDAWSIAFGTVPAATSSASGRVSPRVVGICPSLTSKQCATARSGLWISLSGVCHRAIWTTQLYVHQPCRIDS
jgi:hypothetical protein